MADVHQRALNKLAAECHRAKWEFDYSEEDPPTRLEALRLLREASRRLALIGDTALMLREQQQTATEKQT